MNKFLARREQNKGSQKIDIAVKFLAIYFAMMPFDSFPVFGMGSLLKIIAILPIITIVILHNSTKITVNRLTSAFIIYVFFNLITCIYSIDFIASFSEITRLIMNGALIIAVGGMYKNYNEREYNLLLKALIFGGIATVILTFFFSDTSSGERLTLSINGASQDQNYINGYMYFAFSFFTDKIIKRKNILYIIPCLFLLRFTLLTGSRGATLALIALGIVDFMFNLFNTNKIKIGVMITGISLTAIALVSYNYIISLLPIDVAMRFSSDYIANYSGTNRNILWLNILNIFNESNILRQIFGYGYGTVPIVNTFDHLVAHNLWIEHLISGGIIGLFVFSYLVLVFLIEAWRERDSIVFSAYIGLLTMCLTLSLTNYKPIWNCMMMIMILYTVRKHKTV